MKTPRNGGMANTLATPQTQAIIVQLPLLVMVVALCSVFRTALQSSTTMTSIDKIAVVITNVVRPELTSLNHHSAATLRLHSCTSRTGMSIKDVRRFATSRLGTNL